MIDRNYLGHELIDFSEYYTSGEYICNKCNIVIFSENNEYCTLMNGYADALCDISCNDYIIKNIIE